MSHLRALSPILSAAVVKNLAANAENAVITGLGRVPEVGNGSPLQYSCLGNLMDHGQRSLVDYSPWSQKE